MLAAMLIGVTPGCSLMIAASAPTLRDLDSKLIVHERFGLPQKIEAVELLNPDNNTPERFLVEKYHVHERFNTSMPIGAPAPLLLLADPYLTCKALYDAAKEKREGHHLEFVYDESGNTIGHKYPAPWLTGPGSLQGDVNVLNWESVNAD